MIDRNSKEEEATFFSEKVLKPRMEYHIAIRSQYDPMTGMH